MAKSKIFLLLDALMFLCLTAIAGIGFLMKYVLPAGREAGAVYGKKVALSWLGLDRHDWGAVHIYLAFLFLGLLLLHIILHWQMITGLFQKFIVETQMRSEVAILYIILCGALLLFPFFIQPEIDVSAPGKGKIQGEIGPGEESGPHHASFTPSTALLSRVQDGSWKE